MSAEAIRAVERLSLAQRLEPFESGVGDLDRWLRHSARTAASDRTQCARRSARPRGVIQTVATYAGSNAHSTTLNLSGGKMATSGGQMRRRLMVRIRRYVEAAEVRM